MKINRDLYMRISDVTGIDYSGVVVTDDVFFLEDETIVDMIKDLLCELNNREESIENLQNDIRNNYEPKKFDPYYEYGVSERDFH